MGRKPPSRPTPQPTSRLRNSSPSQRRPPHRPPGGGAEAALPTDYEAVTSLLESFAREKASADELTFLRFCLHAPQKLSAATRRPLLPLIDCLPLADESDGGPLAKELTQAFLRR